MFNATVLSLPSAARATYSSGQLSTQQGGFQIQSINVDINVTALTGGTTPTVTFKVSRVGADGVLYQVWQPTALSAAGVLSQSIGPGEQSNEDLGALFQIDMVVTGAPTSITFSMSVEGKSL
jgi:hypothetical protein